MADSSSYSPEYHRAYYQRNREKALSNRKQYQQDNPDKLREWRYQNTFGISLAEYERMFEAQNGVCAICREPETATRNGKIVRLAIEHNHATDVIRGLTCRRCNSVMGYVEDDALLLRAMADYLEKDGV